VIVLKIGDFSRLARVTIKTLRFYDNAGLFHPAFVEPRSGYRFYSADQLPELQRIRLLREFGCSLAEVRELTALPSGSPGYARHLAVLRKRLMLRVARDEQRLRQLDALLHLRRTPVSPKGWPVRERRIAPVSALTARDRVRTLGTHVESMFEATEQQAARHGCRASLSPFLLFHDMEYRETQVDVEVCVPIVPESVTACGGRLVGAVDRAACLRFAGSYDQAPRLYELMLDWMDSAGARIAGAIREAYLRFGANQIGYTLPPRVLATSVTQYQTELQIPIANT
jgi:DNA-binding transcriptional MerR regulator/effector-binding domain-containing protein